jgi:3-oxoacyl-[acyl-carrier-protein] synthase II
VTRTVLDPLPVAFPPAAPGVLTGWAVSSPLGSGVAAFTDGLRAGRTAVAPLDDRVRWPVPQRSAAVVPGFDVRTVLGPKGTRSMDRATGLAVATVGALLGDRQDGARGEHPVGLVLGTGTGSVQSMMDFTRDSFTQSKPFHVDPARFPSTVMNCAAGQCAIWHGLRGPNTTIAGGRVTGLLALSYALRLQRTGHADTVACGSVEELSVQRSWLEWHSRDDVERQRPLGEGCAVFLLEPAQRALQAGRAPVARVLALEFGLHGAVASARVVLARCIRAALRRAGVSPRGVGTVALSQGALSQGAVSQGEQPLAADERAAVSDALEGSTPVPVVVDAAIGDTSAASAAFQLAAVLAIADRDRYALVTAVDRDGGVGCGVLQLACRR